MFGLIQVIKSPTLINRSSTSLTDNILASVPERISLEVRNSFIAPGKSVELKMEVCTKKINFDSLRIW